MEGTLEHRTLAWWNNATVCNFAAFLVLFVYTIWEARNRAIFKNLWTPSNITSALLVQKAQEHRSSPKLGKPRFVTTPGFDKSYPWAFFDGVSQGDPPIGGAGGVIFLNDTNKISFKLGLGRATNNKVELSTLWAAMKIAKDKHITRLHIYGDSKYVIDWETGKNIIRAPDLHNLLKEICALQPTFKKVLFKQIHREHKTEADTLSKKELAIQTWII